MNNQTRRQFLIIATAFLSAPALAADDEIYTSFFGNTGAGGYDVVAYFSEAEPIKGTDTYSTEYKDAEWHFSSQENLDKFKQNPDMYVPQYGGYCAYAIASGSFAGIEPEQFTVVNGKLYLNYNHDIQKTWKADRDNFIQIADKRWPALLKK